ncbi:MAG: zinc-ribbon domain-containing protein [Oscillospiraceae bacterium]
MFCRKCGTQLPDDSIFCHKCGAGIEIINAPSEKMQNTVQDQRKTGRSDIGFNKPKYAKSKRIQILIIVFAVITWITISEISVNLPQKGTEDFNEYFGVSISDSQYNYLINDRVSVFGFIVYSLSGGKEKVLDNIERKQGVRIRIEDIDEFKSALS